MTFIRIKKIHGKKRYYLEKSARIQGKVKKYSLYLKEDLSSKPILLKDKERELDLKIDQEKIKTAIEGFSKSHIFTEKNLYEIEEIKLKYQQIVKKLTAAQLKDVLDRFTINFTYESNAIEGNSLTLKDVTFLIFEQRTSKNKDLREVYETINTRKAIEFVFRSKPKINTKNIVLLHKMLVHNTGVNSGYKTLPNFLLGRNVKTTAPEKVVLEIEKLVAWQDTKKTHPLELAAGFHGKFEKIHPFEDGNGRVGRLLINLLLLRNGYPPLIIRKSQRLAYFKALAAFDNGNKDLLVRFIIDKYKQTYKKFFEMYVKYLY